MKTIREIWTVTVLNLSSLRARPAAALVVLFGIGAAVAVLISVLSMSTGLLQTLASTGRDDRVIIESRSGLGQEALAKIASAPGIRRDSHGRPLASAEVHNFALGRKAADGREGRIGVRGVGAAVYELHPELQIVAGHTFRPALHELIVGDAAARQFEDLRVGSQVTLADGQWIIVGRFVSGGNALQSELLGDVRSVMSAFHSEEFDDVIAMVGSSGSLRTLEAALSADPTLGAQVQRESEYYRNRSSGYYALLRVIAFAIGGIMSIGALAGAVNTFYSTVTARAVEMATLRAVGFSAGAVMFGVLAEALVVGLVGAACGAGLAWLLFNGNTVSMLAGLNNSQLVYSMRVTNGLLILGIVWGCVTGLAGGVFPAVRAARLPVATALRAI